MKPKTDEKRSWIGANVTPEFKDQVAAFVRTVDDPRFRDRTVADFIRLLVVDFMKGELVRIERRPHWPMRIPEPEPVAETEEVGA